MGCIITGTLFIDRHTVLHFIGIYQVVSRNDRRPSAVTIVIHLSDGIQCISIRNILNSQNCFLRILSCYLEQLQIIIFQIIFTHGNDFFGFLFCHCPVIIIQSFTHSQGQSCTLGNPSSFSRHLVQVRSTFIQLLGNEITHFLFRISGNLSIFSRIIIINDRHTAISPVHDEILISTEHSHLCNQVFLYCFISKFNALHIVQECVTAADSCITIKTGSAVGLCHITVGQVFVSFPGEIVVTKVRCTVHVKQTSSVFPSGIASDGKFLGILFSLPSSAWRQSIIRSGIQKV